MAKSLMMLLVSYFLAFLCVGHGRPIPPSQIFTKTASSAQSQPAQHIGDEPRTPAPEVARTSLDDCTQFCSLSYPEHTYPNPSHHKACVTGCHSAQVDALIAWPFKSSTDMCASDCSEAYPGSSEQHACKTGCNVTTIDSIFPDRETIYSEVSHSRNTSQTPFYDQASDLMDLFFDMISKSISLDSEVDKLTEHANQMSQLLPPVRGSSITFIEEDGNVIEYREYNFEGGLMDSVGVMTEDPTKTVFDFVEFPIVVDDIVQLQSSSADPPPARNDNKFSDSLDGIYVYYGPSAEEKYRWLTRRIVAKRVLLGISVVLIGLGLLMCCLGVLRNDSERFTGKKKLKTFIQSHSPSTVKVPLDRSSEYQSDHSHLMVPVNIKVGGTKTVEGVMTVVV